MHKAAVITISDKAAQGLREDLSGPAVVCLLTEAGYDVTHEVIIPDDQGTIEQTLTYCADELGTPLIVTTGGTGFSLRDVTPEATIAVCDRMAPGIPEAMRAHSLHTTDRAMLSRAVAGLRGRSLILNLPGSPKAARENLWTVIPTLAHGLEVLTEEAGDCAICPDSPPLEGCPKGGVVPRRDHPVRLRLPPLRRRGMKGEIISVNISDTKSQRKTPVLVGTFIADHGIEGDAHAGSGPRQVSLLGTESIDNLRAKLPDLTPGAFAENIVTEGITLHTLPIGTRLTIGAALCEVTQIGKDCHDNSCAIRRAVGDCVMPREGVFVRVLESGEVRPGDAINIV